MSWCWPLRQQVPLGLSSEFGDDQGKQGQWRAFLERNDVPEVSLSSVVSQIREGLMPVLVRAAEL